MKTAGAIKLKRFLIGYIFSLLSMIVILMQTVKIHQQRYDFSFINDAKYEILLLAIPAGLLVLVLKNLNIYISILLSLVVGPLTAALYIYLRYYL
jgi:hypothetical protein